jgi:ribonuclease P protein component
MAHMPENVVLRPMTTHTFKRNERLKSRKTIERLFRDGQSFPAYPLRLVWLPLDPALSGATTPVQFTVTVSKKNFRRAVHRNRIKRLVREAWRLRKGVLYAQLQEQRQGPFAFLVIYTAKEMLPFSQIDKAMHRLNSALLKKLPV